MMMDIILIAPIIAVITAAVATIIKNLFNLDKAMPAITVVVALFIGLAAYPFTSLAWDVRLWSGFIAGLVTAGALDLELLKSTFKSKGGK